jgi:hypothetical protein
MNQIKGWGGVVDWLVLEHLLSAMSIEEESPPPKKFIVARKD